MCTEKPALKLLKPAPAYFKCGDEKEGGVDQPQRE